MGALVKLIKGLLIVALGLACLFLLLIVIFYVVFGVIAFCKELSVQFGVSAIYVYASPFFFYFLGVVPLFIGDFIETRSRPDAWRAQTVVQFLDALFGAIAIGWTWILGIGGLITGPLALSTCRFTHSWTCRVLAHASVANPTLAGIIGAVVGLPLAIRMFWRLSPLERKPDGRIGFHYKPFKSPTSCASSESSIEFEVRADSKLPRRSKDISLPLGVFRASWRDGFIWIGAITIIGTLCGIAASWSGGLTAFHLILAIVASTVTGIIAALQWRLTSKRH